jgi:hypothetical protein
MMRGMSRLIGRGQLITERCTMLLYFTWSQLTTHIAKLLHPKARVIIPGSIILDLVLHSEALLITENPSRPRNFLGRVNPCKSPSLECIFSKPTQPSTEVDYPDIVHQIKFCILPSHAPALQRAQKRLALRPFRVKRS